LRVKFVSEGQFMNGKFFTCFCGRCDEFFHLSFVRNSNWSGQRIGAATGAIIGGAATGHFRGAALGAAAGAAAGALTGAANRSGSGRALRPPPPGGFRSRAGPHTGALLQPLYRARLQSSRRSPGGLTRDIDTGRLFRKP